MRVLAVIPARFGSTRFPGKPLIKISGREMILRVCDQVKQCQSVHDSVVATDDQRIFDCVTQAGYVAVMTRSDHETGTDRLVEVVRARSEELILNVQGDEPFCDPSHLDLLVNRYLKSGQDCVMATLNKPVLSVQEMQNPNVVKSLVNQKDRALYFSRACVPWPRDGGIENPDWLNICQAHIGVYLYQREFLLNFASLPKSSLEAFEKLEQLRVLDAGYQIYCVKVDKSAPGIDTPEDLIRAENWLKRA